MIPASVSPKYIAAFDREETVLRALIIVLCNVVMKIGKMNPLNRKASVSTISASQK